MKETQSNYKAVNIDEIFTSKANVLKFLQKKIKRSKIEMIYNFTINEWKKHENEILKIISNISLRLFNLNLSIFSNIFLPNCCLFSTDCFLTA